MISRHRLPVMLVVLLAAAATGADALADIQLDGYFPTGGPCRAVTGEGTVLYFGTGGYLVTTDIANPGATELLALSGFNHAVQDVVLMTGDETVLACVCLGVEGLRLIDVTDPAAPQPLGGLTGINAWGAAWIPPRLYVLAADEGVLVVDPTDPSAPVITGSFLDLPGQVPRALSHRAGSLFVACLDQTLNMFSVAQPDEPLLIGSIAGSYLALACRGDLVLALTVTGMDIIDAGDFSSLTVIGSWLPYGEGGRPIALSAAGDRVWIADRVLGFYLVDISTPDAPVTLDLLHERYGQAWTVGRAGELMALGTTGEGVRLCVEQAAQVQVLGNCAEPHPAPLAHLGTSGDLVIGADDGLRLSVFPVASPGAPTGQCDVGDIVEIQAFDADDGVAFVAAGLDGYPHTRLVLFDVTDPADPRQVYFGSGLPAFPAGATTVAMDGHLAFVEIHGIFAYDVSDPTDPQNAGGYGEASGLSGIQLLEQNALVTWDEQDACLIVVDRTDPWYTEMLEILPVPNLPSAMAAWRNRFYAATTNDIWIFDVTTPGQSLHLGTVEIGGYVRDLAVTADGVWAAIGASGLELWDLSDPAAPSLRAALTDQGRIDAVVAVDNTVLANAPNKGLLWLTVGTTPVPPSVPHLELRQNAPNPFNPQTVIAFTLDRSGPTRLEIYDLQGRQVRRLVDGFLPAGPHSVAWDGRRDSGQPVASGTYFYRLSTSTDQFVRKMTLLK